MHKLSLLPEIISKLLDAPLNRERKLQALGRFVAWQIGSRLLPGPVVTPFVNDAVLVTGRGSTAATANLYYGLAEFEEMAFGLHFLRGGDCFIDVGANIGSYTVLASKVCGARVAAIEPAPQAGEALRRNVLINAVQEQVTLYAVAAGERDDEVAFSTGLYMSNHILRGVDGQTNGSIQIPLRRLDGLLGACSPALIKIDVEGYEAEALRGMPGLLDSPSLLAVIIELKGLGKRYGEQETDIDASLRGRGFRPYRYDPWQRALHPVEVAAGNGLYLRQVDAVAERVRSAAAFTVRGVRV